MIRKKNLLKVKAFVLILVLAMCTMTLNVFAAETWDDVNSFFNVEDGKIIPAQKGNGNDVNQIWNTSTLLKGNYTVSTKVTMDLTQGDDVAQKASLIIGDNSDYDSGPNLVVMIEIFYFNGEGGKCIADAQLCSNGNWTTVASESDWAIDLGNEFFVEFTKLSETKAHITLKAVNSNITLIDEEVTIDADTMALCKNYGVASRTGHETFSDIKAVVEQSADSGDDNDNDNPATGSQSIKFMLCLFLFSLSIIVISQTKRASLAKDNN